VVLLGELDMDSAPDLQHVLEELIAGGPPEIVLDLSNLDFMDSSGLAVLISCRQRLHEKGRRLRVRSLKPNVVRVFAAMASAVTGCYQNMLTTYDGKLVLTDELA